MESSFFGEILILFLMFLNCSRIFFLKYGKVDSLTILAPICLILAVLQITAWNADIFSFAILLISIFCFIINFRAFLRFINGLYVDHYSAGFKIGAILVILLCIFEAAVLFIFRPVILNQKELNVKETKVRLSGNFTSGFEKTNAFEVVSGQIRIIQPKEEEFFNGQKVVLIADKRADSVEYIPFMQLLAQKGYKVYCGDFYARDVKWFRNFADFKILRKFCMQISYLQNPVKFDLQKEFYSFNTKKEIDAMLNFILSEKPEKNSENEEKTENNNENSIYFIGDLMSDICFDDSEKEKPTEISGFFKLSSIPEYKSKGFGFVQQTSPFTAYLLKLEREPNLENLKIVAEKTLQILPKGNIKQFEESSTELNAADKAENKENTENSVEILN